MTRPLGSDRTNWHTVALRVYGALAFVLALLAVAFVALALGV